MGETQPILPVGDVSTEYDADMSASVEATLIQPSTEVRPDIVPAAPTEYPTSSIAGTELSGSDPDVKIEDAGSDVFGPASVPAVATSKSAKRKGRKASRGKLTRLDTPHSRYKTDGRSGSSRKQAKTARSRSSTAEADVKPTVVACTDDEDEVGDCIVVVEGGTSSARPKSRTLSGVSSAPVQGDRGGLFSASRWISALPGIGNLFSPNRGTHEPVPRDDHSAHVEDVSPAATASGRKRKTPTQLTRSYSEPQLAGSASAARSARTRSQGSLPGSVTGTAKRAKLSQNKSAPVIIVDSDDEEEDPLLLSPESARQKQVEEMAARQSREAQAQTQSSTGRYDGMSPSFSSYDPRHVGTGTDDDADALESQARGSPLAGPSRLGAIQTDANGLVSASPARTAQHARVLDMVKMAQAHAAVIASMNHTDLNEFSEMIDSLKTNVDKVWRQRMSEMRQEGKRR